MSCVHPYCKWLLAGLLSATLLAAPAAHAHETRPAYLEITETAPGQCSILWRTPVLAGMRLPLVLKLPDDVQNLKEPIVQELADSLVERRWIDAGPHGLAGKRIEFIGPKLPWPLTSNCLFHKVIEPSSSFRRRHVGLCFVLALGFCIL